MQVTPTSSSCRGSPQVLGVSRHPTTKNVALTPFLSRISTRPGAGWTPLVPNRTYGRGPSSKVRAISLPAEKAELVSTMREVTAASGVSLSMTLLVTLWLGSGAGLFGSVPGLPLLGLPQAVG